jgi:hypothetical protein
MGRDHLVYVDDDGRKMWKSILKGVGSEGVDWIQQAYGRGQ